MLLSIVSASSSLRACSLCSAILFVGTSNIAVAASCWIHNGSVMRLEASGDSRQFIYEMPRRELRDLGIEPGTLLLSGVSAGQTYVGMSRIFSVECPNEFREYKVSGPILRNHTQVILYGQRQLFRGCVPTGKVMRDTLVFNYLQLCPEPTPDIAARPTPDIGNGSTKQKPSNEGPRGSSGTGFFVSRNHVLTNNHVIKDCGSNSIQVAYPERRPERAYISGEDNTNDLALLQTDLPNASVASFRIGARLGDTVATYGFPFPGLLSSSGNFTVGNITSLTGMNDDTRLLQTSTPTPQNINFAIQTPMVVNFLTIKGVSPIIGDRSRTTLEPANVADIAKGFTVQITCGQS
jgi:hypothetical protein